MKKQTKNPADLKKLPLRERETLHNKGTTDCWYSDNPVLDLVVTERVNTIETIFQFSSVSVFADKT